MAEAPPLYLVVLTIAVYLAFLMAYNETILDPGTHNTCTGLVSCSATVLGFIGTFFDVLTLGGFNSPLPLLIQAPLLLFFAFTWGKIILDAIIEIAKAFAEAIPL